MHVRVYIKALHMREHIQKPSTPRSSQSEPYFSCSFLKDEFFIVFQRIVINICIWG